MMKLERQIETYIASLPNQPQLGKRLPLTPIYRLKCVGGGNRETQWAQPNLTLSFLFQASPTPKYFGRLVIEF
jgi:hypothetical protein